MHRALFLIIVTSLVYSAVPAQAQRSAERGRIVREIERTDRESAESVRNWLMEHRVPRRIHQADGRIVELVGVRDGHPVYLTSVNRTAAFVTGTQYLYPGDRLGLDLTGLGIELGIWDGGHVLAGHRELEGRVVEGDEAEISDHATHVAGTLIASGIDPRARGMAYEAALTSYSWDSDATEMTNEATAGMTLSNHSYSIVSGWHYGDFENTGSDQWYWVGDPSISTSEDYMFGRYDVPAVQFDRVTYTNPYFLPVVAAGNDRLDSGPASGSYRAFNQQGEYQTYNVASRPIGPDGGQDGYDTLGGSGVAKNVLTVGSVGYSSRTEGITISGFSSFGPTDDGRIKPDVMGVGENLYSLSSGGVQSYGSSSGTSMATPNVAGSIALLQQYHRDVYGSFMRAATLKALVIHTAADLAEPGPDYRTGWGLLDAAAAADHLTGSITNPAALVEETLVEGDTYVHELSVAAAGVVRVTLSWTDPPSARVGRQASNLNDPTVHLKNDLDLRVVHVESGTEYMPFVLDRSHPQNRAGLGDNRVDPVEQVYVSAAQSGRYVVMVSHKNDLYSDVPQDFSLVVSGAEDIGAPVGVARVTSEASLDGVTLQWSTLFEREAGTFEIERGPAVSPKSREDDFVSVGALRIAGGSGSNYEFVDELTIAGHYRYRIVYVGESSRFVAAETEVTIVPPDEYEILSSYPNPFHERTRLVLDLPRTQHVTVEVYDAVGRRVLLAYDGELAAGRHDVPIQGDNWPAGVYFARVSTPNGVAVHQIVRL